MRRNLRAWVYSVGPLLLLTIGLWGYVHISAVQKRDTEAREMRLYDEAKVAASQDKVQVAYRIYSHLCQDGSYVHKRVPNNEQPCVKATALSQEIRVSYNATVEAIERYRTVHGKYPVELTQVARELPPQALRAFAGFKLHQQPTGAPAVETGMYGHLAFSLHK